MAADAASPSARRLARRADRALAFAESPEVARALGAALRDPALRRRALEDPRGFLREHGIRVPRGLRVEFLERLPPRRPTPDYEFFTVRFFNCRTVVYRDKNGMLKKEDVCFGIQIIPHPLPHGPIG